MKSFGTISTTALFLLLGLLFRPRHARRNKKRRPAPQSKSNKLSLKSRNRASPKSSNRPSPNSSRSNNSKRPSRRNRKSRRPRNKPRVNRKNSSNKPSPRNSKSRRPSNKLRGSRSNSNRLPRRRNSKNRRRSSRPRASRNKPSPKNSKSRRPSNKPRDSRKNSSNRPSPRSSNRRNPANNSKNKPSRRNRTDNSKPSPATNSISNCKTSLHMALPSVPSKPWPRNALSLSFDSVNGAAAASPTIDSAPTLAMGTASTWATQLWSADIPASSTAAIGLDSLIPGRPIGTTPTPSTSITSMVATTCTTPTIPALVSQSPSCSSKLSGSLTEYVPARRAILQTIQNAAGAGNLNFIRWIRLRRS